MQQPVFRGTLQLPEGTPHRNVFWDGNHAASPPLCSEGSADLSTRALLILTLRPWKAMEVAANCSLRVKRPLLDPRFEGYKLSLEPLPCYQLELDAGGKRRRSLALLFSPSICLRGDLSLIFLRSSASKATEAFPRPVGLGWTQGGRFWRRKPIPEPRGSRLPAAFP